MLTESGRVVAVERDGLWVETRNLSACRSCSAKNGCGQTLIAHAVMKDMSLIKAYFADSEGGAGAHSRIWVCGDEVKIGVDENALVFAALSSYLLPLLAMLLSTMIAAAWSDLDGVVALSAFFGLLAGGLVSRYVLSASRRNARLSALVIV